MLSAVRVFLPKKPTLPRERQDELLAFAKKQSLRFANMLILDMALHHRSFSNESQYEHSSYCKNGKQVFIKRPAGFSSLESLSGGQERVKNNVEGDGITVDAANSGNSRALRYNNERLEFLGDTVLGLSIASYLYKTMPEKTEGELSKIKSVVVSEMTLSQLALAIGIDSLLVLGKGEEFSGGRQKKAILADALEAVIGAVYMDSGYVPAEKFVLSLMIPEIIKVKENRHLRDYKTILQEYSQKKFKHYPEYILVKKTGPDHDRTFWVSVQVNGQTYGPEKGKNKKEAEQASAKIASEQLNISEACIERIFKGIAVASSRAAPSEQKQETRTPAAVSQ